MSAIVRDNHRRGGFTLIEIMVAITLLTVILAIVYGSFSSVVMSTERTRAAAERLKTTEFISRSLAKNLAQASEGWLPGAAYRPYSEAGAGAQQQPRAGTPANAAESLAAAGELLSFKGGRSERGGKSDELSFVSTAPLPGGESLPGQLKLCRYVVEVEEDVGDEESATPPLDGEEQAPPSMLVMTESLWTEPGAGGTSSGGADAFQRRAVERAFDRADEAEGPKPVTRSVPVLAWDLAFFDGKAWLEQWDSQESGRLPWAVRVRVKLEHPEDDEFVPGSPLDPEKDPGVLELFFQVPAGVGIHDAPPEYVRPSARESGT